MTAHRILSGVWDAARWVTGHLAAFLAYIQVIWAPDARIPFPGDALRDVITWTKFRAGRCHGQAGPRQGSRAGGVADAAPRPGRVTDPAFSAGGFFDPADMLQV